MISFTVSGFTNSLTPGSYTSDVTTYDANGDEIVSGTTSSLSLLSPTTTTLAASPGSPSVGASVSLTATVTATNGAAPTGTVTFSDGSKTLGTGTLAASTGSSATATYTVSAINAGTYRLCAELCAKSA
ncbi:MAG: Ig-like domain-containing protein [Candidatus Dormibacteria bacterium]